jgi:hypothetical protein
VKAIRTIFLTWRKGKGNRRKIVGIIRKNAEGVRFEYVQKGVEEASKEGFTPYTDFPAIDKVYQDNVLEIFGQRLIKTERTDSNKYLSFWDIDPKYRDDKYYLLAYTQGMQSNDNFEFLADFNPVRELRFVTEISGLSHTNIQPGAIAVGDILSWEFDNGNSFDKYAVKLLKGKLEIGYVKMIHSKVFYRSLKYRPQIRIKSIDQNGKINRVFIEISYPQ